MYYIENINCIRYDMIYMHQSISWVNHFFMKSIYLFFFISVCIYKVLIAYDMAYICFHYTVLKLLTPYKYFMDLMRGKIFKWQVWYGNCNNCWFLAYLLLCMFPNKHHSGFNMHQSISWVKHFFMNQFTYIFISLCI
jgi:hypothetical protein